MPYLTGKAGIRAFLLDHIGEVVTTEQIRDASGNQVQYSRRLRELRDEEGWPIQSHRDAADLKPGQYRLATAPPANYQFRPRISARVRAEVLVRNGQTCQMCGAAAGDLDDTGRRVTLQIDHIVDRSHGGGDDPGNLRALCTRCNQGAKNVAAEPPSWTWLLAQIRRATVTDQRAAYEWLANKFKEPS